MPLELKPYTEEFLPAVRALNERLRAGNMPGGYLFDERLRRAENGIPQMDREQLLLVDGEHVRGGVLLQPQPFRVGSEIRTVINLQTPVSEGRVDHRFAHAAPVMIRKMQARQPLLFALGMGDLSQPWPRLLQGLKWNVQPMPFFFRVANAKAFLTNIGSLKNSRGKRVGAAVAAYSGAGRLALRAIRAWRRNTRPLLAAVPIDAWDTWADSIWSAASQEYSLIGRRTVEELPKFLPVGRRDLVAWRMVEQGRIVAWAAAMVHRIPHSSHFGQMTVGSLLDCLSLPGYEERVVLTASKLMEESGADMLLSNQTHRAWRSALQRAGYFGAPSNYILGTSPELSKCFDFETAHITRADGDGRIHL